MSTFIMLVFTFYMITIYIKSLLKSNPKEIAIAHEKYLKELSELEERGVSKDVVRKGAIFFVLILTLVFISFYTISSIIIGEYWAAFTAATFSVVSVRNYLLAIDYFTFFKIKKNNWFTKLSQVLGLIYALYFLYFYANLKFSGELLSLVIGIIFAVLIVIFVKMKKKKSV